MKTKLFTILTFILLFNSLCFAKIETIKDEFYGTEYYQTEVANISYLNLGRYYTAQIRFRTMNRNKNTIILDIAVILRAHAVFVLKEATLRCLNGKMINLISEEYGIVSDTGQNFTFTGGGMEAVRSSHILTQEGIEAIKEGVDMLRITTKNGFTNLKITQKESKKIVDILNELLKHIETIKDKE